MRISFAEVMHVPPLDQMGVAREEVADWLEDHGYQVHSMQPWINAVRLFRVRDPALLFSLLHLPPQALGNDRFVHFMKRDEIEGFRGAQGFRQGLIMFLGILLDL